MSGCAFAQTHSLSCKGKTEERSRSKAFSSLRSFRKVKRGALPRVTGLKRTASLGDTWPIFQSSVEVMVQGHTKPPRLGPSNIRATGMSPAGMRTHHIPVITPVLSFREHL